MSGYQTSTMILVITLIVSFECACRAQGMGYPLGCYFENEDFKVNRLLKGPAILNENVNMTLQICQNFCMLNSTNTCFGIQFGNECFCGEYPPVDRQVITTDCDINCKGDKSQKCGGNFRISVYTVCPKGYYGTNCLNRCHCREDSGCIRNGIMCLSGVCQTGWQGSSCSIDYDECTSNTTNSCSHKCINTPGSYNCSCWDNGYELIGRFQCEDIDECSIDNGGCEQKCNNTPGTYNCLCDDGFRLEENNRNCAVVTLKPSVITLKCESWKWTAVGLICALVIALCAIALLVITIYRKRGRENCTEDKPVWTALLGILHTAKSKPKINTPSNTPPDDTTRATGSDIIMVADDVRKHTYQNLSQPSAENDAICKPSNFPSVVSSFEISGVQQTCGSEKSTTEPTYETLNNENTDGAIGFYTQLQL